MSISRLRFYFLFFFFARHSSFNSYYSQIFEKTLFIHQLLLFRKSFFPDHFRFLRINFFRKSVFRVELLSKKKMYLLISSSVQLFFLIKPPCSENDVRTIQRVTTHSISLCPLGTQKYTHSQTRVFIHLSRNIFHLFNTEAITYSTAFKLQFDSCSKHVFLLSLPSFQVSPFPAVYELSFHFHYFPILGHFLTLLP